MKAAALFDLDGTLIDSLPDIVQAINDVRAAQGKPSLGPDAVRAYVGKGADFLVRAVIVEKLSAELRSPDVRRAADAYIRAYQNLAQPQVRLYPGVAETLKALHEKGVRLAVVTNKATSSSQQVIKRLLPNIPFAAIHGPESVTARKPHPAHILETLEEIGVLPTRALMVGDDSVDAECARAAGVPFYAATWGIGRVRASEPRANLSEFGDLLPVAKRLFLSAI